GILLHGPLLGWAKMMGDQIFVHSQQVGTRDDTIQYLMPRRVGLEFGLYPWHAHLKDAVAGAKAMLTALGEWHHTEQDVRQANIATMVTGQLALNKVARSKALAGVLEPHNLPAQTTLHILDQ
ncbi:unnamed protein product, partial [Symbiodinium sp. KB8]